MSKKIFLLSVVFTLLLTGFSFSQESFAANTAPTVDAGPDVTIDEGDTFSFSGTFTDPDTADTWIATVDYGDTAVPKNADGTCPAGHIPNTDDTACILPAELLTLTGKTFSLSHTYPQDSVFLNGRDAFGLPIPFTVTVTVSDGTTSTVAEVFVRVENVLPAISPLSDVILNEGETLMVSGSFTDPGFDCSVCGTLEDFVAIVNWGEFGDEPLKVTETPGSLGVLTQGTAIGDNVYLLPLGILIPGGDPFLPDTAVAGHVYRLPGDYAVKVTVDDDAGTASDTFVTTVLGPQDLKNRVISTLSPFDSEDVEDIIEKINESL